MKFRRIFASIIAFPIRSRLIAMICIGCFLAHSATCAGVGTIFDDDWTPPKPVGQPHAVPVQPTANAPTAATPATNPAVSPPSAAPSEDLQSRPTVRRAIPAKADQAHSRGLLKAAFAPQLKDRTVAGRKKLAVALLEEVPKTADNSSDEYVLLGGAIEASKDAGALDLCFRAADIMSAQYEVDGLGIKIDAVLKTNLRGDSPATATDNLRAALGLIDPLLAGEDFLTASRVLAAARPVAARDPDMAPAVQDRSRAIETLRATHDRAIVAFDKLKTAPNEPSANFAAGSYLCFYKGQWEQGLPMLAKGSDPNIKQLAALEMLRPTTADEMLRLADGWRDTATKQPEVIRPELLRHALSQYKMAREVATGLQRALLERRIADVSMAQSASIQAGKAPGPEIIVNSIAMKFVRVKAGSFVMGSPVGEAGRQDDETQHKVQLTQSFYMQTTPVTQVQWNAIMESNPSHNQGDALPVDSVTWDESVEFCKRLGQKDGKHYRLPTEAEWEYACRAGSRGVLSDVANLNDFAWYSSTSEGQTHPVARKKPNELGLYDMLGNVAQLCSDGYGPYHGDAVDPTGADNASSRVLRGGSWSYPRPNCRAAFRNKSGPGSRHDNVGFRVCLDY